MSGESSVEHPVDISKTDKERSMREGRTRGMDISKVA
ncbi:hypothetical protein VCR15J5_30252 [Vibrio crassostreae]|nr:hypothetical protein VCR15J5_30252 [Vibrio crassostreae]